MSFLSFAIQGNSQTGLIFAASLFTLCILASAHDTTLAFPGVKASDPKSPSDLLRFCQSRGSCRCRCCRWLLRLLREASCGTFERRPGNSICFAPCDALRGSCVDYCRGNGTGCELRASFCGLQPCEHVAPSRGLTSLLRTFPLSPVCHGRPASTPSADTLPLGRPSVFVGEELFTRSLRFKLCLGEQIADQKF